MTHRISTTAGLVTATLGVAALLCPVGPAQAQSTCTDALVRCSAASVSPYAQPLDALGGLTLAQYLADHMTHRIG